MKQKVKDQFKKLIFEFYRNNDIDSSDMKELLRNFFEFFATEHDREGKSECDFRKQLSKESLDDFKNMWENFVQQSIDYVRNHEDVQKLIERERADLEEEWNKNLSGNCKIVPDVRLSYGVDGLDESIEAGKWTTATDSGICLSIGNRSLIQML